MIGILFLFLRFTLTECVQLCTLTITVITATILVKTYQRNKKNELENHFFKLKIDAYSSIVYEFENLFAKLREVINDFDNAIRHEETMPDKRLQVIKEQIDKSILQGDLLITKYSIFFLPSTVEILQRFTENLYGYYDDALTLEKAKEVLESYYDRQLELANKINVEIRKELKIEDLNKSLFQRY
ncbi:hypothetical protein H9N25_10390 [Pedobacter riviphilus]|uniref:5-bromo-4-chloroindolyl phosphate hydrolysis protein n=1 Tax=Pedobacter riviphilus TaxID=2766984 RepID=A0ABX6TMU2_9SPHI|nr:hypothetical protein [Pedobacter riviphilus]QNR86753.1 hypothetical protein H9N25_10390 [Pedobacter riviphilus]